MSDDGGERMNKAQRLALAAEVAPSLRAQSERASRRVVKVYDQATGAVVRHATLADVQRGILETAKIELECGEGKKPTHVPCELCGKPIRAGKRVSRKTCRGGCDRQQTCAGAKGQRCDAYPPEHAWSRCAVARRNGAPWRCARCTRLHKQRELPFCGGCKRLLNRHDIRMCLDCYMSSRHKSVPPTACKHGHPWPENRRTRADGGYCCAACSREASRRYSSKKRGS